MRNVDARFRSPTAAGWLGMKKEVLKTEKNTGPMMVANAP
jgi:hypothetical protein